MAENRFNQLAVWQGTTLGDADPKDFVQWFEDELNTRIQWCEAVTTLPDVKNGREVEGTGGRSDLLFYVHDEDVTTFAVKRFHLGHCSWWEDVVVTNDNSHLYSQEILDKYKPTW